MATAKPKKKPKKPTPRGTVHVLTEEEKVVAHLFLKHGSQQGAAKAAQDLGCKADDIKAIVKKPGVQRYLQQYNHAFLREMARYELSKVTRFPVSREDVIGRLYALALTPPEDTKGTIEGQVKAVETISEILGLKFNPRDADTFFKDRTTTELDNYAIYGKFDPTEEEKKAIDAAAKQLSSAAEPDSKP